jgi:hypothetical protein
MWFRRGLLGRPQKSEEEVKQTGAQHVSEVLNKMNFGTPTEMSGLASVGVTSWLCAPPCIWLVAAKASS